MSIPLRNANDPAAEQNPVRNGNRWHVTAINAEDNRLAARRLDDNTVAVLDSDYLREHITHGYAVTVHSAQGVTADTSHAVLGDSSTRNLFYVAMTRGRHTNTAHLYERITDTQEQTNPEVPLTRGNPMDAARLVQSLIARGGSTQTAHQLASREGPAALPDAVAKPLRRSTAATRSRHESFRAWQDSVNHAAQQRASARQLGFILSRDTSESLEL